jgi:hypothetical protein
MPRAEDGALCRESPRRRYRSVVWRNILLACLVGLSLPFLTASSLRGTVVNAQFKPLSGVNVRLASEPPSARWKDAVTGKDGTFLFSDVPAGEYTVAAHFYPYVDAAVRHIRIGAGEDFRLRRLLLDDLGEGAGNCVVRLSPAYTVQHTNEGDLRISGRVSIGRQEKATVDLAVFGETELTTSSTVTGTGKFSFIVSAAGDVRLGVELLDRSGRTIVPRQQLSMPWADLGDRISIPSIKVIREGLGHWCY